MGSSAISRMVVGVTDQYSTPEMLEEVCARYSEISFSISLAVGKNVYQPIMYSIPWRNILNWAT